MRAGELRKDDGRVRLQEQPFRILTMLLERPGEVVLREEICRKLWPNGTIVEVGHGINAAVQRLREALGDSAESPQYVETLARRGYRFIAEVEVVFRERAAAGPSSEPVRPSRTAAAVNTANLCGRTVAHYRVVERVGGGGMGVVYRAEDVRLGRQVALKFLPPEMSTDSIALGRFQREARAASALNHPNICTVYGVEEYSGQPFIAMEMLEGPTLKSVIDRGPLAVERALALAIQMADALDGAHRKGVVHRDFKPGNVVLTRTGIKVLDFGLAKMEIAGESEAAGPVTREGAILGTPHYMSPEQVQGKDAGAASDIFSFGVVVYEMLCGRRPFEGENSASVMAAILTSEPAGLTDPPVPASFVRVLRRCLAKAPEDRWQSARDLKAALEWVSSDWAEPAAAAPVPAQPAGGGEPPRRTVLPGWRTRYWVATAVAVVALCVSFWEIYSRRWSTEPKPLITGPTSPAVFDMTPKSAMTTARMMPVSLPGTPVPGTIRFTLTAPGGGPAARPSLSPDGHRIAFLSGNHIYLRDFDTLETRPLEGAEGPGTPFWSPHANTLALASGGKLRIFGVDGTPTTSAIAEVNTNLPGTWGPDGTILIGVIGDGIFRIPVSGGPIARVTSLDSSRNETRHLLPQFLPSGNRFLFVAGSTRPQETMLWAGSLDSGQRTPIMPVDSGVTFVPLHPSGAAGYLVYLVQKSLVAQPFDSAKLQTTGQPVVIAGSVGGNMAMDANVMVGDYSVTPSTLAYRSAEGATNAGGTVRTAGQIVVVQNWMAALKP